MPVALTHPSPRGDALAARLTARGLDACALPFRDIQACLTAPAIAALRERLAGIACVIFVSPSAIDALAAALGPGALAAVPWLAVVGPGSADALRASGLAGEAAPRILQPLAAPHDGRALAALPAIRDLAGNAALLVHGEDASDDLAAQLSLGGLRVERLVAYRSVPRLPAPVEAGRFAGWLAEGRDPCVVFTAGSTVGAFTDWSDGHGIGATARQGRALAIHPRIANRLREAGWSRIETIEPGEAALSAAIESRP